MRGCIARFWAVAACRATRVRWRRSRRGGVARRAEPGAGRARRGSSSAGTAEADLKTARRVIEIQGNVSALLEDLLAKGADDSDEPRRPR